MTMTIFNFARQSGKTSRLFREMEKNPSMHMVCASERRADYAWRQSCDQGYNFPRWRFHSPEEAMHFKRSGAHPSTYRDLTFCVDQLQDVLSALLRAPVVAGADTAKIVRTEWKNEPVVPAGPDE